MTRVLVTGSTGTVGAAIVSRLVADGRHVRALVRDVERAGRHLAATVELVSGDVVDAGSVRAAIDGCDVVYHAAGLPEQWQRDPTVFGRVNVGGTRNVIEAAIDAGVRSLVYTSTIDVFDWQPGAGFDESVIDQRPKGTYYERSKQAADRLVVAAVEAGLPARFAHPAAVYGPTVDVRPGANRFLRDLATNKIPVLLPGGMPMVHSDDVATGHLALETAAVGARAIFSGRYATLAEISAAVHRIVPTAKRPRTLPGWAATAICGCGEALASLTHRPPLVAKGELHFLRSHAVPDSGWASRHLAWRARSLEEGLADTLPALRATVWGRN
jgi:dihydroflavonol-4-reductase